MKKKDLISLVAAVVIMLVAGYLAISELKKGVVRRIP